MLQRAIARDQMALPSFAAGGPFPGRWPSRRTPPEGAGERAAIATLYVADDDGQEPRPRQLHRRHHPRRRVGVQRRLGRDACRLAFRGNSLYRNTDAEGTAMGVAAALAFRALGRTSVFPRDIDKIEPWTLPDLADYYARWRARV